MENGVIGGDLLDVICDQFFICASMTGLDDQGFRMMGVALANWLEPISDIAPIQW